MNQGSYTLVSPSAQTPKSSSEIPNSFRASINFSGASAILSIAILHVPQCIATAFLHCCPTIHQPQLRKRSFVNLVREVGPTISLNILTASIGALCTLEKSRRGAYAPMGINPSVKGPRRLPISANAGQTGRVGSMVWVSSGTWQYPVHVRTL